MDTRLAIIKNVRYIELNILLVVHPLNQCNIWDGSDATAAWRAVPAAAPPDERVLVGVPILGGALDGFLDLGPSVEAPPLQGPGAQHLPPGLDEVQVGGVFCCAALRVGWKTNSQRG
jgi:hypothetical protein